MRTLSFLPALLLVGTTALTAWGADLGKIDRTIKKEPAYRGKPKYCLLVLGPEAKTRVWLVLDGETLYVDRNGNGDLTEAGEKAAWRGASKSWVSDIPGPGGKPRYALSLRKFRSGMRLAVVEGKERYFVGDPDGEALVFADRPSEAPVAHVGGPLSIDLSYYPLGGGSLALRVRVGTRGVGKGAFAALVLPAVTPVAEVEFPPRKPGGAPLVTKVTLKDR